MQKLIRLGLSAFLFMSALTMPAFASNTVIGSADYVIVDGFAMSVMPTDYMQASSVLVTIKTNTGYTASQQTTPGAMVTFNLPDNTTRTTVETKYVVGATEHFIIELVIN